MPFVLYWSLCCVRLNKLLLNIKIRRRLFFVQLTYTLVPILLVLLRASRLLYKPTYDKLRRLTHDAELVLALLGCAMCMVSLVWRPVREAPSAAVLVSLVGETSTYAALQQHLQAANLHLLTTEASTAPRQRQLVGWGGRAAG